MTLTYISIDPGEKYNGICGYDEKYVLMWMVTKNVEEALELLDSFEGIKTCIIEEYIIYPQKARAHIYSKLMTPRVIAKVESWAARNNVEVIKQLAAIKPTGYMWIGKKPLPKSNPQSHALDAHVHFIYWAVKSGKLKIEELLK